MPDHPSSLDGTMRGKVIKKVHGLMAAIAVPVFLVAGAFSNPLLAQEKKAEPSVQKAAKGEFTLKEVVQNDKMRVQEAIFKPGDVAQSAKRPMRAIYAIKGGTVERTYEDGKKEKVEWKTGESRILSEEKAYSVKNISRGVVHLVIVSSK